MTSTADGHLAAHGSGRPRAHDGRSETELQILAATETLLGSTALSGLSVARICGEAQVSRTTFYFYFSSKYAPVSALLLKIMDEIYDSMSMFTDRPETPHEPAQSFAALDQGLTGSVHVFREHRMVLRAVAENWHVVPELRNLWLGIIERFTTAFAAEIDRERARGNALPGLPSRQLAAGLIWACERVLYVSGLGLDQDLPDEGHVLPLLQNIWKAALYGSPS